MTIINIGGVPEHFNVPWKLAMEEKIFEHLDIQIHWRDCPGGTGEMVSLLNTGVIHMAIALTEGTITAIANHSPLAIQQWFVCSPLQWGIHVAADSDYTAVEQLKGARFAISRFGSGSHLMSFIEAQRQGWDDGSHLQFVEVANLTGGINALSNNLADAFLWERFTTQPWVDQGIFRRIGVCPTPWPAFAMVINTKLAHNIKEQLQHIGELMSKYAPRLKDRKDAVSIFAQRSGLAEEEISRWLPITEWADSNTVGRVTLDDCIAQLSALNLLKNQIHGDDLVTDHRILA